MNNLIIKMQTVICEVNDKNEEVGHLIVREECSRVIDKNLRSKLTEKEFEQILREEIGRGSQYMENQVIVKKRLPYTMCLKEEKDRILLDLQKLIPGFGFSGYFAEGKFHIYGVYLDPYVGESVDISSPLDGQYLTTKYMGLRSKLSDGTWTYGYQSQSYYEGIVERLPAPFDESLLKNYFKGIGIKFELHVRELSSIPEARSTEEN